QRPRAGEDPAERRPARRAGHRGARDARVSSLTPRPWLILARVTKLTLDTEKSRVRIHTFAEGMFARLAHDLELSCGRLSGSAERTDEGVGAGSLTVPLAGIRVSGTLKGGRLDPRGLSASDRDDVLTKMRKDVFH